MKIALSQLDVVRGDPVHNLGSIQRSAKEASGCGADLLCLPEMVTTGFDWKNTELLRQADQHIAKISEIATAHDLAICGSFLERTPAGKPANTLMYFGSNGKLLAKYRKIHLFSVFREDKHVEPGVEVVVEDVGPCKAGFGICYDLRFPELFRANTERGARIQILPAAFPHPRMEHWQTLIRARAIENQCFFIATNQVSVEAHGEEVGAAHYFGHSMVVDPWGEVLAEGGELEEILTVQINLELVAETRSKLPALRDRRPKLFVSPSTADAFRP
ncbi:MAG: nitrilase-related carbon-nitrogen hydrolase [Opitutales bacterium]